MKFIVSARSVDSSAIQIEGTWTVEAASSEEAVALMEQHISLLPAGATWTIRPWTRDDGEASDCRPLSALGQVGKPTAAA